jgi:hypothetical protein
MTSHKLCRCSLASRESMHASGLTIHSNFCKFRFWNPVRYIHYPSTYCYFLESIQDLPFQELFEFAIFDAGIYFVDALQYLAWLPTAGKVAPLSAQDQCVSVVLRSVDAAKTKRCLLQEKKGHTCLLEHSGCPFISHVRLTRAIIIAR